MIYKSTELWGGGGGGGVRANPEIQIHTCAGQPDRYCGKWLSTKNLHCDLAVYRDYHGCRRFLPAWSTIVPDDITGKNNGSNATPQLYRQHMGNDANILRSHNSLDWFPLS